MPEECPECEVEAEVIEPDHIDNGFDVPVSECPECHKILRVGAEA